MFIKIRDSDIHYSLNPPLNCDAGYIFSIAVGTTDCSLPKTRQPDPLFCKDQSAESPEVESTFKEEEPLIHQFIQNHIEILLKFAMDVWAWADLPYKTINSPCKCYLARTSPEGLDVDVFSSNSEKETDSSTTLHSYQDKQIYRAYRCPEMAYTQLYEKYGPDFISGYGFAWLP